MTNLEWIKEQREYLEKLDKSNGTENYLSHNVEQRIKRILFIIAEELCLLREKPTVINNVNFPNK